MEVWFRPLILRDGLTNLWRKLLQWPQLSPYPPLTLTSLHLTGCVTMEIEHGDIFTINSLYCKLIRYREENNCFWCIWTTRAPLNIKVHMWLSLHDCLLMVDNLAKWGNIIKIPCLLVGQIWKLPIIFFSIAPSLWDFRCRKEIVL